MVDSSPRKTHRGNAKRTASSGLSIAMVCLASCIPASRYGDKAGKVPGRNFVLATANSMRHRDEQMAFQRCRNATIYVLIISCNRLRRLAFLPSRGIVDVWRFGCGNFEYS